MQQNGGVLNKYNVYCVEIFDDIKTYFSGICCRSRSAVRQPSDFSPAIDGQKTILWNRALFSTYLFPTKNHKTTIIPLEGSEDFWGGRCGKSNALSEAAFPTSTPFKNRWNRGGDDRQVSQNGMPFCTGCTLSGHILNLQGSSTPFEPLVSSPKMKLRNIHRKFLRLIFGFAGESTRRFIFCTGWYFGEVIL